MTANFEWYDALAGYFPACEMKSLKQMMLLCCAYPSQYRIEVTEEYVLVTYETPSYIFVDYLLVRSTSKRGTGIGSRVLDTVKIHRKLIVLEIEPPSSGRPETVQRQRFYIKNGFKPGDSIGHNTERLFVREPNSLLVMVWYPSDDTAAATVSHVIQRAAYSAMCDVYRSVHTYAAEACYGWSPQPLQSVVTWKYKQHDGCETETTQAVAIVA